MNQQFFDVIVIGAGPAGLAVANTLQKHGIRTQIFEKGAVGDHIRQYPTYMRFFSTKENLEIDGFPMQCNDDKPNRQEYLSYLRAFIRNQKLWVDTFAEVTGVEKLKGGNFEVSVQKNGVRNETWKCSAVVAACGAWECPRRLGVPGDDLPKVHYRFLETHDYWGKKVLVVGGRNSAIDTALQLFRGGADVTLSYRGVTFDGLGVKYWLKPDIENRLKNEEIKGYLESNVVSIDHGTVTLRMKDGEEVTIENDFVLPCLGYDPPVKFMKSLGIEVQEGTNVPHTNPETLESNIAGLFIVGTIVAGNVSGKIFIENSRHHGKVILGRIQEILESRKEARERLKAIQRAEKQGYFG